MEDDLQEMESSMGVKSPKLTHGSKGTLQFGVSDLAAEIADLKENIEIEKLAIVRNLNRTLRERTKLEQFIEDIEDPDLRMIFRLKNINGLKWHEIGKAINMERTTASKKYKAYLKKISHNSH